MARILESQGKDSDAEYVLRTIIKNHSRFMPAYCDLAEVLVRQRRIEEAVQILRVARSRAPDDAVLVNDLGMCCLLRNDFDAALAEFTRAAALAPDDARYRGNMAVALGMMGRYSESLALYRQVTSDIEAHYNLAVLCEARHDHLRANAEFNAAREARNLAASARAAGADAARDQAVQTAPRAKEGFAVTTRPTG